MSFSERPGHVFRKHFLIALRRLAVVGRKSATFKYWDSSGLKCSRLFFTTFSDCFVPSGTYHIPVFLFLVTLIISSPFFGIDICCFSSVMVYPSSHNTPNDTNVDVYIFGQCGSASLA